MLLYSQTAVGTFTIGGVPSTIVKMALFLCRETYVNTYSVHMYIQIVSKKTCKESKEKTKKQRAYATNLGFAPSHRFAPP